MQANVIEVVHDEKVPNPPSVIVKELLHFHRKMLKDVFQTNDSLLLAAKGLGLETHIVPQVMKQLVASNGLIFVLNFEGSDEVDFFKTVVPQIKTLHSAEFSQEERQQIYSEGGVVFVTARVLCVDMLTKRVPVADIAGMLVLHAHSLKETSNVAFILRLYRQFNEVCWDNNVHKMKLLPNKNSEAL